VTEGRTISNVDQSAIKDWDLRRVRDEVERAGNGEGEREDSHQDSEHERRARQPLETDETRRDEPPTMQMRSPSGRPSGRKAPGSGQTPSSTILISNATEWPAAYTPNYRNIPYSTIENKTKDKTYNLTEKSKASVARLASIATALVASTCSYTLARRRLLHSLRR
jgi:hypothetical protein